MDTHNNNSIAKISAGDVFKPTRGDAVHTGIKVGLETIPLLGSLAAELYELKYAAPATKRAEQFFHTLAEGMEKLQKNYENFNLDELTENEVFKTTVILATEAAIRTHSKEKHRDLRNAVLNAALPKAPDENRQTMFIQLRDELTDLHMHILKLFGGTGIPSIDLGDKDWRMNIALDDLADVIEAAYPRYVGQFHLYVQAIDDLHRRGLIANMIGGKDTLAAIHHEPTLTPFAKEFLAFLKSPLDDD